MIKIARFLMAIILVQFSTPAKSEQWRCFINYQQYECTVRRLADNTLELKTAYYEGQTLLFSMRNNGTYSFRNGAIESHGFWTRRNRNGLEFKSGEHTNAPVIYLEGGW